MQDDLKTLHACGFEIGDYLDIAITLPPPPTLRSERRPIGAMGAMGSGGGGGGVGVGAGAVGSLRSDMGGIGRMGMRGVGRMGVGSMGPVGAMAGAWDMPPYDAPYGAMRRPRPPRARPLPY